MKKTPSRTAILAGFIAIFVMQVCVLWVWYASEGNHMRSLANLAKEQREQQIIFALRDAAHKRALSLFRMAELEESFDRDREYLQFLQYGNDFVRARDDLVAYQTANLPHGAQHEQTWESVRPLVLKSAEIQSKVAELLRSGHDAQAHQLLRYAVISAQEEVMNSLTAMLQAADAAVQEDLEREKESSRTMSVLVFIFAGGALALAVAIGIFVSVRTARAERTLVEQSQHMEMLKDMAESSSRAKSAFLANMSHEIRTPLTAIIGFSESLLDPNATSSDRLNATQTVIRCGKHLLQVINDILDLSKIEAEKLHIEKLPVDIFQIIDDVGALASVQASGKGIAYSVDYAFPLPAAVDSDPMRLKQILFNLVSNAIKFTHSGGVRVRVSYRAEPNLMCFDVIDTGIGLTEEQKLNLFTAFNQADVSTSRKFGGTGLGLHLSRALCRELGGDITLESTDGVGSIFTATIDAGASAQTQLITQVPRVVHKAPSVAVQTQHCGTVLVADDVNENRQLISLYLRKMGVSIRCVENGLHAVNSALGGTFDLILMDIQMPVMDGLEATAFLRGHGYSKPIVALTANVMKDEVEKCMQSGCDGFLAKPINRAEFTALVARYLKPSHTSIEAAQLPLRSELLEREPELAGLVARFLDKLPGYIEQLAVLCRDRNWNGLMKQLHDFKSIAGNYGFPQMSSMASQAENEIRSQRFDEAIKLIEQITATAERAAPQRIMPERAVSAN